MAHDYVRLDSHHPPNCRKFPLTKPNQNLNNPPTKQTKY